MLPREWKDHVGSFPRCFTCDQPCEGHFLREDHTGVFLPVCSGRELRPEANTGTHADAHTQSGLQFTCVNDQSGHVSKPLQIKEMIILLVSFKNSVELTLFFKYL